MICFDLTYYKKQLHIIQYEHYYYYEKSFYIENESELTTKQYNILYKKIVDMNLELKKAGYDFIENVSTNYDIIENLQENEYLKDGTTFCE